MRIYIYTYVYRCIYDGVNTHVCVHMYIYIYIYISIYNEIFLSLPLWCLVISFCLRIRAVRASEVRVLLHCYTLPRRNAAQITSAHERDTVEIRTAFLRRPPLATTHCVKQPMEHVLEKASRARGCPVLTWRLPSSLSN
jgi:hypothetical protein